MLQAKSLNKKKGDWCLAWPLVRPVVTGVPQFEAAYFTSLEAGMMGSLTPTQENTGVPGSGLLPSSNCVGIWACFSASLSPRERSPTGKEPLLSRCHGPASAVQQTTAEEPARGSGKVTFTQAVMSSLVRRMPGLLWPCCLGAGLPDADKWGDVSPRTGPRPGPAREQATGL